MEPLISVILTYYNQREFVKDSIESVLNQTYKKFECIVVDDGSVDDTGDIVKSYADQDSRIKYIYKENGGVASARNVGVKKSLGNWIQFLDGDDWLHRQKLENQINMTKGNVKLNKNVIIYSDYTIVRFKQKEQIFEKVVIGNLTKDQILKKIIGRRIGEWSPFSSSSILLSRSIFDDVWFNENSRHEDLIFYYQVLKKDCQCIYVAADSMYYRQYHESSSHDNFASITGYADYMEIMMQTDPADLRLFPNMKKLIDNCILNNYNSTFRRLKRIVIETKVPVYITVKNLNLNLRSVLKSLDKIGMFEKFIRLELVFRRKLKAKYNVHL